MTIKNPQSSTICEHMHQMIANMLRMLVHLQSPRNDQQASDLIDTPLAMAICATRASIHQSFYFGRSFGVPMRHDSQFSVDC
jgi:hypothetical protein